MTDTVSQRKIDIVVAGMLAVDFACDHQPREYAASQDLEMETSNPAKITQSLGGVGHNVARAAQLSGAEVRLCSAVGDDMNGSAALKALDQEGLSAEGIATVPASTDRRTAQYIAVNDTSKDLVVAMADMSILDHDTSDPLGGIFADVWQPRLHDQRPNHVVIDGNWPPEYLKRWIEAANEIGAYVTFEPVSSAKSSGIFHMPSRSPASQLGVFPSPSINLTTPNEYELSSMYDAAREKGLFDRADWWQIIDAFGIPSSGARPQMSLATSSELVDRGVPQKCLQLLPYIPCITTKLGAQGVLVTQILARDDPRLSDPAHAPHILSRTTSESGSVGGVYMRLFPPPELVEQEAIVSVNGVGDTFVGVLVAGLARQGEEGKAARVEDLVDVAQRASILTLKSKEAVSPGIGVLSMLL